MKHRFEVRSLIALAACTFAASPTEARVLAIDGTVANQVLTNWNEWLVGGIQNRSTTSRDWLLPMNISTSGCVSAPPPCHVAATFKGSSTGASTSIAYAVTHDGFWVEATALKSNGNLLQTMNLGSVDVPLRGFVLVVTNLAGATTLGGTNGGGMTSAALAPDL